MPEQPRGLVPHLVVEGAAAAIDFYVRALGASEVMRVPAEDGRRLLHAEIRVEGARVYLRDHFPEFACPEFACPESACGGEAAVQAPPASLGGTSVTLHLEVADCDAAVRRAAEAGARVAMPPMDAFWGDRYGQVVDPFGHAWSFAHPLPAQTGAASAEPAA